MTNQVTPRDSIGGWQLPDGEILAPMAGVTDSPFRLLCRRFGAGLVYTECISAEGIRRGGRASWELARFHEEERPIAAQLFGSDVAQMAEAAALLAEKVRPDLIDINCGCPVKRFVVRGCGGALMQDPDLIGQMVAAVRGTSGLPVSVKLRAGYVPQFETAPQAAIAAEEAGAALVAVHGRFVRKAKGTPADWSVIGRVKAAVKWIPVVGNGDLHSAEDARRMRAETNCDRVMIGRGAQGNPWIFRQFGSDADAGAPSPAERFAILKEHYQLALEEYPERRAVMLMRKHITWYLAGFPGAVKMRREMVHLDRGADAIAMLNGLVGRPDPDASWGSVRPKPTMTWTADQILRDQSA